MMRFGKALPEPEIILPMRYSLFVWELFPNRKKER